MNAAVWHALLLASAMASGAFALLPAVPPSSADTPALLTEGTLNVASLRAWGRIADGDVAPTASEAPLGSTAQPPKVDVLPTSGTLAKTSEGGAAGSQGEVDMLRLIKAVSDVQGGEEWASACSGLVSGLTSREASVADLETFAGREGSDKRAPSMGAEVLTLNAADQAAIGRCAAHLKAIARGAGLLASEQGVSTPSGFTELIESPWAWDACSDIAHGFLTARLAEERKKEESDPAPSFCAAYTRNLRALRSGPPERKQHEAEATAQEDLRRLRHRAAQHAVAHAAALATRKGPAAAEGATSENGKEDEEEAGVAFWRGALKS